MQALRCYFQARFSHGVIPGGGRVWLGALQGRKRTGLWLVALCSCLVFGGCSPASGAGRFAAEMVQPGKSITWPDGRVIRVDHRAGFKLVGIHLEQGSKVVQASHGMISLEPDGRSFRVTLFQAAIIQDGRPVGSINEMSVLCCK